MGEANAISAKNNFIFCLKSLIVRNNNKRRKFAFVTRRVPFSLFSPLCVFFCFAIAAIYTCVVDVSVRATNCLRFVILTQRTNYIGMCVMMKQANE